MIIPICQWLMLYHFLNMEIASFLDYLLNMYVSPIFFLLTERWSKAENTDPFCPMGLHPITSWPGHRYQIRWAYQKYLLLEYCRKWFKKPQCKASIRQESRAEMSRIVQLLAMELYKTLAWVFSSICLPLSVLSVKLLGKREEISVLSD